MGIFQGVEGVVYKAFKELGWSKPEDYNDLSSEQIEGYKIDKMCEKHIYRIRLKKKLVKKNGNEKKQNMKELSLRN